MAKPVGNHQTGSLRGSLDECELPAFGPVWNDNAVTSPGTSQARSSLGQRTPLAERSPQELAAFLADARGAYDELMTVEGPFRRLATTLSGADVRRVA